MKILLKYPTRGRPAQFLSTLSEWLSRCDDPRSICVLVSYDLDDDTMTGSVLEEAARMHPDLVLDGGPNGTKIEACNAGLKAYPEPWDVVLLVSDDMRNCRSGWDETVRLGMKLHFPDTDGALWFFDGRQREINTLECVGRRRYERFGYLYHPSYASFFCDNESTEVGLRDMKIVFLEDPICRHDHPGWGGEMSSDATYLRNNRWWTRDAGNFKARKLAGFPS